MFDTNVVVSGFLSPAGPPGRIVEWLRNGEVQAVVDDRIMAEYAEVLARPVLRLPVAEVELVLASIRTRALWTKPTERVYVSGDELRIAVDVARTDKTAPDEIIAPRSEITIQEFQG